MTEHERIFGLMVVRNEADVLRVNLLHHFSTGIDRILVIDNGSIDGTPEVLREFAAEGRLEWKRDPGSYRQASFTTELAREAHRQGANWVIPIDADEFWYCPSGSLREVLAWSRAGALLVEVLNFVQRRDQRLSHPGALIDMTHRVPVPVGPLEEAQRRVESGGYAFVEVAFQPKWVSRASADIEISMGNHHVSGVSGLLDRTDALVCFHVPLRSREALQAKAEYGHRRAALGLDDSQWWQVKRWLRMYERGELETEWTANSYLDGTLDVFGVRHPLVFDPRLRDLLRPWVAPDDSSVVPDEVSELRADLDGTKLTIHHQLHAALRLEAELRTLLQKELSARNGQIVGLQEELRSKVDEANDVISQLRMEMETKIATRDERILALQQELFLKVGEANDAIHDLRAEMDTKIAEANAVIRDLQKRL